MPKQEFKDEVEKFLTGESEASDLIYFKLYKSQIPVIEQALETAARMLGSDKSRGYCLEMICADFLAGANLDNGNSQLLVFSLRRYLRFLPVSERSAWRRSYKRRHERGRQQKRSRPPHPGSLC